MKSLSYSLLALAALSLAPLSVSAQTTTDTKTVKGDFRIKSTDAADDAKGKYVSTITTTATGLTEQTVFTRSSDQATSTNMRSVTHNSDGTRTVTYSHTDFGAMAAFTSTKTITPEKHGDFYGTGTYTTAAGVSGVLSTLESNVGPLETVAATYTTSTGVTHDLRLNDSELGLTADKIVTLNPDGTVTNTVVERYITGVSK